jgi:hypothetical protein
MSAKLILSVAERFFLLLVAAHKVYIAVLCAFIAWALAPHPAAILFGSLAAPIAAKGIAVAIKSVKRS